MPSLVPWNHPTSTDLLELGGRDVAFVKTQTSPRARVSIEQIREKS